jgi:hypothetical protein
MPKIKLSALVSDMKGKANGSVFSKNSGGVYFRNNPSGGGRKSAKWDKQKGSFSEISRYWRQLTELQQQSWIDIAPQYPTTNAFGDTRIPSGYELFCRLNGAIQSKRVVQGGCDDDAECPAGYMCIDHECQLVEVVGGISEPLLKTPLSPRAVPSVGAVQLNYPDLFQLNPTSAFPLFDKSNPLALVSARTLNVIDGLTMYANKTISMRVAFLQNQPLNILFETGITFFNFTDINGNGWNFQVYAIEESVFKLQITAKTSTGNEIYYIDVNESLFKNPFHFTLVTETGADGVIQFYINGKLTDNTKTSSGTFTDSPYECQFRISNGASLEQANFLASDLRLFKYVSTAADALRISNGYVLGTEYLLYDMVTFDGTYIKNWGLGLSDYNLLVLGLSDLNTKLNPVSFGLVPQMSIELENLGIPGMLVNIYSSPPLSYGKTGSISNLKLLGTWSWDTIKEFSVYKQFKKLYGNYPAGSNIEFYVQALDGTTGDMLKTKTKKGKGKPRFKAGTDMTEKVN